MRKFLLSSLMCFIAFAPFRAEAISDRDALFTTASVLAILGFVFAFVELPLGVINYQTDCYEGGCDPNSTHPTHVPICRNCKWSCCPSCCSDNNGSLIPSLRELGPEFKQLRAAMIGVGGLSGTCFVSAIVLGVLAYLNLDPPPVIVSTSLEQVSSGSESTSTEDVL